MILKILFFFFKLCHVAHGILVPRAGIEPGSSAVRVLSPNHWTAREFLKIFLKNIICALQIDVHKEKFSLTYPSSTVPLSETAGLHLTVHLFQEDAILLTKYHIVNKIIGSHVKKILVQSQLCHLLSLRPSILLSL